MYEAFYGFKDKPFSMLPDPGFLFLSKKHKSALTLLEYGLLNHAGFCVISGRDRRADIKRIAGPCWRAAAGNCIPVDRITSNTRGGQVRVASYADGRRIGRGAGRRSWNRN